MEGALTAGGGAAFLVGDALTLADVAAVPAVALFLAHTLDAAARDALPALTAYVVRPRRVAGVLCGVLGALCLCETPLGAAPGASGGGSAWREATWQGPTLACHVRGVAQGRPWRGRGGMAVI
eukprot:TRINITY_DN18018_c0_g1_i1.p2 TRINITY_DN18018_c0_g1~~TRINITY_DN18018_c0_g1_i1.p2  ORF type:complete len:123 (+),score=33.66 TRINITY_DN18018_c0_g1_i1:463-831(+)